MTVKEILFLLLAIAGAALTWYFNIQFMQQNPGAFDIRLFVSGGLANPAAASLTMDIFIAAVTGLVWMGIEAKRLGMKHLWFYYVSTCLIAFAFAFPFFLFQRERHLTRAKADLSARTA